MTTIEDEERYNKIHMNKNDFTCNRMHLFIECSINVFIYFLFELFITFFLYDANKCYIKVFILICIKSSIYFLHYYQ